MRKILYLILLLAPFKTFADQNALLSKNQADKAVSYIKTNGIREVILWCGCCNNDPMQKVKIKNIYSRYTGNEDFYEVVIQGDNIVTGIGVNDPVDLSYVWIPSGKMAKDFASVLGLKSEPCSAPFDFDISQSNNNTEEDKIFNYLSEMPEPTVNVIQFLAQNLKYPEYARKNNIEGRVLIQFVIDENGNLIDPKVIKGIGGGCDEEALRVIKKLPRWIPGKDRGVPVKVYYSQPITFKLSNHR